jgi:hypothetical protein
MDSQSTPVWLLSGRREGLSGVLGGRAARPTNNHDVHANIVMNIKFSHILEF